MEEKEGYKVVRYTGVTSIYVSATSDGAIIEYKINMWVKPHENDGPLACFSSLPTAFAFASILSSTAVVFKCKYKRSQETFLWSFIEGKKILPIYKELPSGTVLADEVMLILGE